MANWSGHLIGFMVNTSSCGCATRAIIFTQASFCQWKRKYKLGLITPFKYYSWCCSYFYHFVKENVTNTETVVCSKNKIHIYTFVAFSLYHRGKQSQIAKFMGPTWGPPGSCRPQMGPMLAHEPCYQGCYCSLWIMSLDKWYQVMKVMKSNYIHIWVEWFAVAQLWCIGIDFVLFCHGLVSIDFALIHQDNITYIRDISWLYQCQWINSE